jgi:hypothetical protein
VVVGAGQVEVRRVAGAGEHERRVDLVGDDPCTVPGHDVADPLELGPGEHPAPRVVRLGQQQRAGTLGQKRVEPAEVDLGPGRIGVDHHVDPLAARDRRDVELRRVARHQEDDGPVLAEHVECQPHAGGHVDDRSDPLRLDDGAVVPGREPGVRLCELGGVPVDGVAGHAVANGAEQGLLHHGVEGVVHLGDPGRDHVVGDGSPLEHEGAPRLGVGQVDDRTALGRRH